jgi:hypothetical protein
MLYLFSIVTSERKCGGTLSTGWSNILTTCSAASCLILTVASLTRSLRSTLDLISSTAFFKDSSSSWLFPEMTNSSTYTFSTTPLYLSLAFAGSAGSARAPSR